VSASRTNGRDEALPGDGTSGALEVAPATTDEARESEAPTAESPDVSLEPAPEDAASLRRERDELRDTLLRRRAEFENYKKRVERDQRAAAIDAAAEVFRRLIDTVDNLERALAAGGGEGPLRQGVELTLRDLLASLEAQGVAAIDALGRRFDPLIHQALAHEPVPGVAEGTIAEVFRKGYTYKDRLLRPALVKVASGEPQKTGEADDASGGADVQ